MIAVPLTLRGIAQLREAARFVAQLRAHDYPEHLVAADDLGDIVAAGVVTTRAAAVLCDVRLRVDCIPRRLYIERDYALGLLDAVLREAAQ